MKPAILYLCHRIPYPPNKGDKIASYHLLKYLSQHYDVYLGCFIDDPTDWQYCPKVDSLCRETCYVALHPTQAKLKSLRALLSGQPMTLPYYASSDMRKWVNRCLDRSRDNHPIRKALVFSSSMAQYLMTVSPDLHKVMHFVDLDSEKWRQYAEKKSGLMRLIYQREYHTLARYEKQVCAAFDVSCFVTDTEKNAFTAQLPDSLHLKVRTLENGIDSQYFSPDASFSHKTDYLLAQENYVVFTGAMDYWANVDAVCWFVQTVWPIVLQHHPDSRFYIVGSSPTSKVKSLSKVPGVVVTGRVADVRPFLFYAKAAVAPMQIARGIQNKILEAMAMEKPVLTSPLGIEGLEQYPWGQALHHQRGQAPFALQLGQAQYEASNTFNGDRHLLPPGPDQMGTGAVVEATKATGTGTIESIGSLPGQTLFVSDDSRENAQWVCVQLSAPRQPATVSRHWIKTHFSWEARLSPVLSYLEAHHG
ncbi:TIGR03087 family PEP-CTERM/XrtA system glycosyltransferase [Photobacterium sp. 1_MG-2023]|uniref:TIGR03087 family PEP-CTERM/XrtA system glycosyltransferase n=1 Tax=Photobacterium sp. 1_MG-2023 TaxID=3062646 RepID=UPI0026E2F4B7|nr:TIGR03087 family PEP-CTERM/XrtA system glycosyltransferase [Photobacterium sp. 1_MG-2023]MDO6705899.1 TIGR03087 family PEP-CTERM/XrtA system glycosyltransferase [Photobacterium sp. 1_MG-2023]